MNATLFFNVTSVIFLNATNTTDSQLSITKRPLAAAEPHWDFKAGSELAACLLTFIGNGMLLYLFIKYRTLRTPFNIYVINLLLVNLSSVIFQYPLEIVLNRYPTGSKWYFGRTACTVKEYGQWVIEGNALCAHELIALIRMWAVCRPVSFRAKHSSRFAVILCLGTWLFVQVSIGAGLMIDTLYNRMPELIYGCFFNIRAQPTWYTITQVLVYKPPLLIMILSVPVIGVANLARLGRVNRLKGKSGKVGQVAHIEGQPVAVSPPVAAVPKKDESKKSHGTLLLVLLVISVTVTWGPYYVFFILGIYYPVYSWTTFWETAQILQTYQTVMDPILFTMALQPLRERVRGLFVCSTPTFARRIVKRNIIHPSL